MKIKTGKTRSRRRKPTQQRACATVDATLQAAIKLLKRGGAASITTNRIAATAGVSIGSVYQYFPDKHAIFIALHERHIRQVESVIRQKISESAGEPLERLAASLVDGMIETHSADPELSELLISEVPHRPDGAQEFSVRLHGAFRSALASCAKKSDPKINLEVRAFILGAMVDSLGHAVALRRPSGVSLARARDEAGKAILAYLKS